MRDYFNYKDKICIVTGASSGMGYETAKMLVDLGAKVYALDIKECNIENLAGFYSCNLSDKKNIDEVFTKLPEKIDCFLV